jgi:hypothetical protein
MRQESMITGSVRFGPLSDYTANCRPVLSSEKTPHRNKTTTFASECRPAQRYNILKVTHLLLRGYVCHRISTRSCCTSAQQFQHLLTRKIKECFIFQSCEPVNLLIRCIDWGDFSAVRADFRMLGTTLVLPRQTKWWCAPSSMALHQCLSKPPAGNDTVTESVGGLNSFETIS